jgi:hypothetical protein
MTASRLKKMMISLLRIAAALERGNGDHPSPSLKIRILQRKAWRRYWRR